MRFLPALLIAFSLRAAEWTCELRGSIVPAESAAVSISAVASPYKSSKIVDDGGRFRFPGLEAGAYTLALFIPGRGEARKTIEIGRSVVDISGRVLLTVNLDEMDFTGADAIRRQHAISTKQLSVYDKALREYENAQNDLARRDIAAAVERLERAVTLAPQFSAAWNNLGTIAYQTRKYTRAEECFRKAIDADPDAFEPLVNLGGVLINLNLIDDAWKYNVFAVLKRPNDALGNSQLGMTYLEMGDLPLAEKHLKVAQRADPAHFSHPQLFLAEIHLRNGNRRVATEDMEDFLRHHPDWPQAGQMRQKIAELRQ